MLGIIHRRWQKCEWQKKPSASDVHQMPAICCHLILFLSLLSPSSQSLSPSPNTTSWDGKSKWINGILSQSRLPTALSPTQLKHMPWQSNRASSVPTVYAHSLLSCRWAPLKGAWLHLYTLPSSICSHGWESILKWAFSRMSRLRSLSLFSEETHFCPFNIFVALCWTLSNTSTSLFTGQTRMGPNTSSVT